MIDTHCHLDFPDFQDDFAAILERAKDAGVTSMQTICTRLERASEIIALAEKYPQLFASVGVHPDHVHESERATLEKLLALASHPKVIGIGETGLDYYRAKQYASEQIVSLKVHIACAQETGLPLIIHTRDAEEDTIRILQEAMRTKKVTAVIHCFTGSAALAEAMLSLGFYISVSGIVTFKNATSLQEVIRYIPADRLLIETDAPYLAPVPMRGKRNEPAYVAHTLAFLAQLKRMDLEEIERITTENFYRLFTKARLQ